MVQVNQLHIAQGRDFGLHLPAWQAQAGQVHSVVGTNGAGKSTLLSALSGEKVGTGSVILHGRKLAQWPALARARHLGVLPQSSSLTFNFTAAEVVSLGLTPLSLGWRGAQAEMRRVMYATECRHLAERSYTQLSGGERQRVQLARVLLQISQAEKSPLLLLDEPTSAQDLGQQHRMLELARGLARERNYCVIAILHDLNLALRYSDDCLLLHGGEAVSRGTPQHVLQPGRVARYWGYTPQQVNTAEGDTVLV